MQICSRGRCCPSFADLIHPPPTEGAGNAGLQAATHGPPAEKKQAAVTTGPADIRHSLRDGFHVYFAISPVLRLFGHRRQQDHHHPPTWHQRRDARTTRLHVRKTPFVRAPSEHAATSCGHRIPRSTFVTTAKRPSYRARDQINIAEFSEKANTKFRKSRPYGGLSGCPLQQLERSITTTSSPGAAGRT